MKKNPLICGIDEAGRGPVIGPLVITGARIEKEREKELTRIGVKDSKQIKPEKREEMYEKLIKTVDQITIIIEPQEIDECIKGTKNLNWLEADKCAEIIQKLNPEITYIDTPSPNIEAYRTYIVQQIKKTKKPHKNEIICEHKADQKYPIASAASIIAKVTRDRIIDKLKKNIKQETGTGYMSDVKTQKFLQENWEKHHHVFRKSWESYKKIVVMKEQKKLGDYTWKNHKK